MKFVNKTKKIIAGLCMLAMVATAQAYDCNVPAAAGAFKSYMGYTAITATGSTAYQLQYDGNAFTGADGLRMYRSNGEVFYMVAVGSYYAQTGDIITVTMSSGVRFHAIVGDSKANCDTDSSNRYHLSDGSVIEFIVDNSALSGSIRQMGDASYASSINLKGRVSTIQPYIQQVKIDYASEMARYIDPEWGLTYEEKRQVCDFRAKRTSTLPFLQERVREEILRAAI